MLVNYIEFKQLRKETRMVKLIVGHRYKVSEGSGLDSNRVGRMCNAKYYTQWFQLEPGRYKDFDSKREVLLLDDNDTYFTMFKDRLVEVEGD